MKQKPKSTFVKTFMKPEEQNKHIHAPLKKKKKKSGFYSKDNGKQLQEFNQKHDSDLHV